MSDKRQGASDLLITGSGDARWTLVLAHGAGQGMDSELMARIAALLGDRGFRVARFEFPYMARIRETGVRRPPDPEPRLREAWLGVIDGLIGHGIAGDRLLIGGKSLGGRVASLIAGERPVAGLVCLGYPFHPPGRPESVRTAHLRTLAVPTLICQGTRDPFGRPEEVAGYALSRSIRLEWIEGGDHGFKPDKASGRTWGRNLEQAADAVRAFVADRLASN